MRIIFLRFALTAIVFIAIDCMANEQDKLNLLNGDWGCTVDDFKTDFGKIVVRGTQSYYSSNMSFSADSDLTMLANDGEILLKAKTIQKGSFELDGDKMRFLVNKVNIVVTESLLGDKLEIAKQMEEESLADNTVFDLLEITKDRWVTLDPEFNIRSECNRR